MRRFLLPLIAFLAIAAFLAVGLNRDPRNLPSPLVGKTAPNFSAQLVGATERVFTPKEMLGKVWILNVWASWCTSCRIEHPLLVEFSRQAMAPVVGLNYKDKEGDGALWLRTYGNPYVFSVFDPAGRIGMDYGVYGVPETFVIDSKGIIRMRHAGPVTKELIEKQITPLIKELKNA